MSIFLLLVVDCAEARRNSRHTVSAKNKKKPKQPLFGVRGGQDESVRFFNPYRPSHSCMWVHVLRI